MIIPIFPILLFKTKVKNHKKIKDLSFDIISKEYNKKSTTFDNPWDSDVFTTFNSVVPEIHWDEILSEYIDVIKEMQHELGAAGTVHINNAWFNAYKTNQSHELHDHLPGQFSAIHYIAYDASKHLPTVFVNPVRQLALSNSPNFNTNDPDSVPPTWVGQTSLLVEEGDLVIFPSFLEHKVPKQKSDDIRIVLAFNFNIL